MDCGAIAWHESWTNRYCIQDGFCPFCARGPGFASERYRVFERPRQLCNHVLSHIQSQLDWPVVCPHSRCPRVVADQNAMHNHLDGYHGISGLQKLANTSATKISAPAIATPKKRSLSSGVEDRVKRRRSISASIKLEKQNPAVVQTLNLEGSVTLLDAPRESFSSIRDLSTSDTSPSPYSAEVKISNHEMAPIDVDMDCMEEFLVLYDSDPESSGLSC
jgi:hypothetical protein